MKQLCIDLLRHGETELKAVFQGRTNSPLSDLGVEQMQQALSVPAPWQAVYSSPLVRCTKAAEKVAQDLQLPLIKADWLQEYDFGDWEAQPIAKIAEQQPEALAQFWQDPVQNPAPNGESIIDFQDRIQSGIEQLMDGTDTHILLVTHGGVIRNLVAAALQIDTDQWANLNVAHAEFTRLQYSKTESGLHAQLEFLNRPQL